jgi:glycosyltransferase involved in cell wall biosynthesis
MPAFNREHWLAEAMDSVLSEDLDLELIALDNGSVDGTWNVIQDRAGRDPRVRPVHWDVNVIGEVYPALLEMAQGDYVNFFADDDRMIPGGLGRKARFLDEHPATGMVFSPVRCIDEAGKDLGEGAWSLISDTDFQDRADLFRSLILGNFVPMPAAMFRRALSPTGAILRDPTYLASHDWQFWLDLARRTGIGFLREPTAQLRLHGGQVTITNGHQMGQFLEVNLRIWNHWMNENQPPFIPTAAEWAAMNRVLVGAIQNAFPDDHGKIHEGLGLLQAIRIRQENVLADAVAETGEPEAFLYRPAGTEVGPDEVIRCFSEQFSGQASVGLLVILPLPVEGAAPLGTASANVHFLAEDQLLPALRKFTHIQWIPPDRTGWTGLEGAAGRRFAEALAGGKNEVVS